MSLIFFNHFESFNRQKKVESHSSISAYLDDKFGQEDGAVMFSLK